MHNSWIQHVKDYAKKKKVSYVVAMKEAKASYKPKADKPKADKPKAGKPKKNKL